MLDKKKTEPRGWKKAHQWTNEVVFSGRTGLSAATFCITRIATGSGTVAIRDFTSRHAHSGGASGLKAIWYTCPIPQGQGRAGSPGLHQFFVFWVLYHIFQKHCCLGTKPLYLLLEFRVAFNQIARFHGYVPQTTLLQCLCSLPKPLFPCHVWNISNLSLRPLSRRLPTCDARNRHAGQGGC